MVLSLPCLASEKIGDLYYNLDSSSLTAEVTYEKFSDTSNYQNLTGAIGIPETVVYNGNTYYVTAIGNAAFLFCRNLTNVEIPNPVTSIGDNAFTSCSGLTSFEIPNSVTSIGYSAFYGCDGLTSVEIGNSVASIGEVAFGMCGGLTSVEIPSSVTSIGGNPFAGCWSLQSINVDESNEFYSSSEEGVLFNKSKTTLIGCPGLIEGYIIPDSVTEIGAFAFSNCRGLTSIEIPSSVTSIGYSAFSVCTELTSVEIGNSVSSIGMWAFDRCINLRKVEISDLEAWCNIVFEDAEANPLYCARHLFLNGNEIKDLVIPGSVASIENYAFYRCSGLTSVVIPGSVISIGNDAFYGCSDLTSLFIGENVSDIGPSAFDFCNLLNEIVSASPTPPAAYNSIFSEVTYANAILSVPGSSIDSYRGCIPWSNFLTIKDLDGTGVDEIGLDVPETLYDVFTLQGVRVKRQASQEDIDALAPGIYIIGGKKVIVK